MAEVVIGFAKFNPGTGNGDQQVEVSANVHTGRVLRTVGAKIATETNAVSHDLTVNQNAKPEFVLIQDTAAVNKEGGNLTLTGTTNSTKLTFSLAVDGEHPLNIELPASYSAAGADTVNGEAIAADPGATAEFEYSITIPNIGENQTVFDQIATVTVTAEGGMQAACVITQAEGDPQLTVDKTVINLDKEGTPQELIVNSNTNWSITSAVSRMMKAMMAK